MTQVKKHASRETVFFDARYVDPDRLDGIGRFSLELLKAYAQINPDVVMMISSRKQLRRLPPQPRYEFFPAVDSARELFTVRKLNHLGAQVVFSPLFNFAQIIGASKMFSRRRFRLILTLHDTFYYQFRTPPSWLGWGAKLAWRGFYLTKLPMKIALNHADAVVTVSKTSRAEIQRLKLTKRPIAVIYNAAAEIFSESTAQPKKEFREKNLLYMGSFFPYKNVETLIKSLEFLPHEYRLILCSRVTDARKDELLKNVPSDIRQRIVFQGGVSDAAYLDLLRNCFALVHASRSEGFNLQLVEAMAAGAPIVCSDLAIHHEVAGPAALYFSPEKCR